MKLRTEDGSAVIEFALVLPILLLLVFGIIEFGVLLYNKEVITNASREGARYGIIIGVPRPTTTQIQNVVTSYLTQMPLIGWKASQPSTSVAYTDPTTGAVITDPKKEVSGTNLSVTVNYPYSFLVLPNLIPGFNKSITLSAKTLMKLE